MLPLKATAVRIVESQEQIATIVLVSTLDEQHVLEQLLETTKPALPQGAETYGYLISTPFRYPPLPHGSRFGQRLQSGIYYGSLAIGTALAECAYYRFVFWSGMAVPPPGARLTTAHTTFEVHVAAARGVALDKSDSRVPSFSLFSESLLFPSQPRLSVDPETRVPLLSPRASL